MARGAVGKGPQAIVDGDLGVVLMDALGQGGAGVVGVDRFVRRRGRHADRAGRSGEDVFGMHPPGYGRAVGVRGDRKGDLDARLVSNRTG